MRVFACAPTASNTGDDAKFRIASDAPGQNRSAVNEHRRPVESRHRNERAGHILSQPPIATNPSMPWQPTTVSIESAITSRDTSEYFIPSVPIEMPSDTVMVLKMMALPPAALTPPSASRASWSMCILHGVTMLQVDAMPTMSLEKSSGLKPTG
jgi:hypothetical protein